MCRENPDYGEQGSFWPKIWHNEELMTHLDGTGWIARFFDWQLAFSFAGRRLVFRFAPLFGILFVFLTAVLFFSTVSLKPEIGENFFFSSDDPQMQEEKKILSFFPQDPQLVFGVKGPIHSEAYLNKLTDFSNDLAKLPEMIDVISVPRGGPGSVKAAQEGPLWSRILIAGDGKSTLMSAFVKRGNREAMIEKVEAIMARYQAPDFDIIISGEPYIIVLLQRYLLRDLKTFSVAAFLIFGVLLLIIFRSITILWGMFASCVSASMWTLILTQLFGVVTGPLTANLSTIVFVLTLSHIIFLTFNWKYALEEQKDEDRHPALAAMGLTFHASFWSMLTTFLGFLSLLLVKAAPLRQLGAAGAVGTLVALVLAYLVFPVHLDRRRPGKASAKTEEAERKIEPFFYRRHGRVFLFGFLALLALGAGAFRLNTDPSLLAYFKKGTELRKGLEYIDQNGGSSPLSMVVHDPAYQKFTTRKGYEALWDVTLKLEKHPEAGGAVSLPFIIAQAEQNWIARLLTMEWLTSLLETDRFGNIARFFVTGDRTKALILLRMRESGREKSRLEIIGELESMVRQQGLWPFLVGGVYSLQGHLSRLVTISLFQGLSLLMVMFVSMGWFLSRSIRISLSMLASLVMIPAGILGLMGWLRLPLDVIAAPAANISIAVGVDSMIHMLIMVRRYNKQQKLAWKSWKKATARLWRPVLYTALVIGSGFGIFGLSNFPPTQRFGLMVVIGAWIAPFAALVSFPFLITSWKNFPFKKLSPDTGRP